MWDTIARFIPNRVLSKLFMQKGVSVLGAFHDLGFSGETAKKQNFETLSLNGYQKCAAVYSAIKLISQNFAEIPWVVRDSTKKNDPIFEGWEFQNILDTPNERTSSYKFREAVIAYYMLGGNSFIFPLTNASGSRPVFLYPIRPSSIKIIPNEKNAHEVLYYKMGTEPNVKEVDPDTMFHCMQFNPLSYIEGMSPLKSILMDIDLNNSGKKWNVALQQNMGKPSGLVTAKQVLSDPQFNRLEKQVRSKFQGSGNAGNVWIGDGDLRWESTSISPADADWIEGLKLSKVEIVTALGVPPEMVGLGEHKTYSNMQEARATFYKETVIPLAKMFTCEFSAWLYLNGWLDPKYYIGIDLSGIAGLEEDETKLFDRLGKADWLTVNEKRVMTGLKEDQSKPEWNVTRFEVDLIKANKQSQQDVIDEDEKEEGKKKSVEKGLYKNPDITTLINIKDESDEELVFKSIDNKREELIEKYKKAFEKLFAQEHSKVMAFVDHATSQFMLHALAVKAVDEGFIDWRLILGNGDKAIAETFAKSTIKDIALSLRDVNVGMFNAEAVAKEIDRVVESQIGKTVQGIAETTKKDIGRIVATGIEQGKDIKQIASDIDKLYLDSYIPNRSELIARTETIKSSNMGSYLGANASPIELQKVWLSTKDSRTRRPPESPFDHLHANGKKVDINDSFEISGEKLGFPGDSSLGASAGNVINCRCTLYYVPKKKARK